MHPAADMARVPERPPPTDLVIAGALSVWALLEAVLLEGPGSTPMRIVAALAMTVPLVWRRVQPFPVVLFVVGVLVARAALGGEGEQSSSFFPSVLLATFSVALYEARQPAAAAGGVVAIVGCVIAFSLGFADSDTAETPRAVNLAVLSFFIAASWTVGWVLRKRVAQADHLRERGDELAREAVVDERARIARELHDIVAHSVSIISVQAGAAVEYVERDPARAREHLSAVQASAHDALTEMRRLTGVLRDEPAGYEPQPGLGRVGELVEAARAGGLDVDVVEDGERPQVPPGVDLAAYRIVQEALTNARKHAGRVRATVRIAYSDSHVEVSVVNAAGDGGNGDGGGHGLVGMHERVRVYGGTLENGPTEDGGYRVAARLPLAVAR